MIREPRRAFRSGGPAGQAPESLQLVASSRGAANLLGLITGLASQQEAGRLAVWLVRAGHGVVGPHRGVP